MYTAKFTGYIFICLHIHYGNVTVNMFRIDGGMKKHYTSNAKDTKMSCRKYISTYPIAFL